MTGREKIEAAFSPEGAPEFAVVIPYEGIYIRDHWDELTPCPWWYSVSPDLEHQMAWRRDVAAASGYDWIHLSSCPTRDERRDLVIEVRQSGAYRVHRLTGEEQLLQRPVVGGWSASGIESVHPEGLADTPDKIDSLIPTPGSFDPVWYRGSGRADLADRILSEMDHLYAICSVSSPLWSCYDLWGFEGMMTMIAERPGLVEYACERFLSHGISGVRKAAALGAAGVWIEECMTDMISPEAFASLCVPFVRRLVEEIRAGGMKSIYYFCGNPAGKWDAIFSADADAVSLEEGKKGFAIDTAEVVERVGGRCVVLGNLDAIGILQDASEEDLRSEIARQVSAGRRNGSRFILSLGSPVTPGTPVSRVRMYCDLGRQLGMADG